MSEMIAPTLSPLGELSADVATPIDVGDGPHGHRRIIPILGGTFTGERLSGRVLGTIVDADAKAAKFRQLAQRIGSLRDLFG